MTGKIQESSTSPRPYRSAEFSVRSFVDFEKNYKPLYLKNNILIGI